MKLDEKEVQCTEYGNKHDTEQTIRAYSQDILLYVVFACGKCILNQPNCLEWQSSKKISSSSTSEQSPGP